MNQTPDVKKEKREWIGRDTYIDLSRPSKKIVDPDSPTAIMQLFLQDFINPPPSVMNFMENLETSSKFLGMKLSKLLESLGVNKFIGPSGKYARNIYYTDGKIKTIGNNGAEVEVKPNMIGAGIGVLKTSDNDIVVKLPPSLMSYINTSYQISDFVMSVIQEEYPRSYKMAQYAMQPLFQERIDFYNSDNPQAKITSALSDMLYKALSDFAEGKPVDQDVEKMSAQLQDIAVHIQQALAIGMTIISKVNEFLPGALKTAAERAGISPKELQKFSTDYKDGSMFAEISRVMGEFMGGNKTDAKKVGGGDEPDAQKVGDGDEPDAHKVGGDETITPQQLQAIQAMLQAAMMGGDEAEMPYAVAAAPVQGAAAAMPATESELAERPNKRRRVFGPHTAQVLGGNQARDMEIF